MSSAARRSTSLPVFRPGGGVDGEMRVLRALLREVHSGQPGIVPRNMQGAGGIILANHLYNMAAADGLTLGMPGRSGFPAQQRGAAEGINYDLGRFSYIGGAGSAANALWVHRRTGITSVADLKRSRTPIVSGRLNARSRTRSRRVSWNRTKAGRSKIVTRAIRAVSEVLIALERGEVDRIIHARGQHRQFQAGPDLIGRAQADRAIFRPPWRGTDPCRRRDRFEMRGVARLGHHAKPYRSAAAWAAEASPSERLEVLRQSYQQLMDDAEYRIEADRRGLPVAVR